MEYKAARAAATANHAVRMQADEAAQMLDEHDAVRLGSEQAPWMAPGH